MFTGIIEEVGEVVDAHAGEITVRAEKVVRDTKPGDSIAVDGVDLTVTAIADRTLRFDVMPETYRKTTLGLPWKGRRVNLERAVRAADRLSGHVVRGVVEGTGRVCERHSDGDATVITYSAPEHILDYIIERGPISVDGVSLTVIAKDNQTFSVSIVRFTGEHTNIFERAVGDPVNLESDIMMRYVAEAVKNRGGSLPTPPPSRIREIRCWRQTLHWSTSSRPYERCHTAARATAPSMACSENAAARARPSTYSLPRCSPNASQIRSRKSCTACTVLRASRSASATVTRSQQPSRRTVWSTSTDIC